MPLRRVQVDPAAPDPTVMAEAAAILRRGGLVIFPTETVYGVGANADDAQAVARLYQVKGRPSDQPVTVHLASVALVSRMAIEWPDTAEMLSRRFWPGPLTLVVPRQEGGSVGLRVPRHPVAEALLAAAGVPVAAPSANRRGHPPPTTAEQAAQELGALVDYLIDAGSTPVGEASTVVDCTVTPPRIVRSGAACRQIEAALGAMGRI